MPVTLELIEDGYVLHYTISDPWESADLMNMYPKELAYRDSTPHVIHSITDLSASRRIPKNWLQLRAGPGINHPRGGEIVLFGLNPGINIIVDTILRATRSTRMRVFKDEAKAWEYIRELAAQAQAQDQSAVSQQ
jgi:hypothetical protein